MRRVILAVILCCFISSLVQAEELITIAVIKSQADTPYESALQGIKDELRADKVKVRVLGYELKKNEQNSYARMAQEIKAANPQFVITLGTIATKFAQQVIPEMPVVFSMVLGAERSSIDPPGVSLDIPFEMKVEYMKRVIPEIERFGVIYSPDSYALYKEISVACAKNEVQILGTQINSAKEFPVVLHDILRQIDCYVMLSDSMIYFPKAVEHMLLDCLHQKIPVVGLSSPYTKAGALISFDCDYHDIGVQTVGIIARLLKGEKATQIGILRPRRIRVSLNSLIAKRLGIEISNNLMREIDVIFGK
ncbi:MAG: hypothetical protein GY853_10160 [PVC group bacterium]|nr:hypothetical protein [PVC group bacterium]